MKPGVLILESSERHGWSSIAEIVPRLISEWESICLSKGILIQKLDCLNDFGPPRDLSFNTVLIPCLTPQISKMVELLRGILKLDFKIIVYAYGAPSRAFLEFYDWKFEQQLSSRDQIIVNCEADLILGKACYDRAQLIVQPFSFMSPQGSARFNPNDFFYLYHGRINPQKNILAMIQSYELTLKTNSALTPMHIVGDEDLTFGPVVSIKASGYLEMLKQYVLEHNLSEHIFFHPFIESEILENEFLLKSHVFISLSQHVDENFGLAAYKSLSLGMPCILSGWGGHWELQKLFGSQVSIVSVEKLMAPLVFKTAIAAGNLMPFSKNIEDLLSLETSEDLPIKRQKWGLNVLALNRKRDHATPFTDMSSAPFKFYFEVYSGKKFNQ